MKQKKLPKKFTELLDDYLTAKEDFEKCRGNRGIAWEYQREVEKEIEKSRNKLNKFFHALYT